MRDAAALADVAPVPRSRLVADLRRLGLADGDTVMVHSSMRALGWVVGGSQSVVEALLECVGERGTVCAQASWEDIPIGLPSWPAEWRSSYEAELPPFDPQLSAAAPYEGRIPERLRTWPGARRSANPAAGIVAVGRNAPSLTADHRLDDGFGHGTPYERVARDAHGAVLLLGAPLHSISLLHHAEAIARLEKRWTTYRVPIRHGTAARWVTIRELDVWRGALPYAQLMPDDPHPLGAIARDVLMAGIGRAGNVGDAHCHLFPSTALVTAAVAWLERRFAPSEAT